LATPRV